MSRAILIPPAVEKAHPPTNINSINKILDSFENSEIFKNWKPVVVDALTIWNTEANQFDCPRWGSRITRIGMEEIINIAKTDTSNPTFSCFYLSAKHTIMKCEW